MRPCALGITEVCSLHVAQRFGSSCRHPNLQLSINSRQRGRMDGGQ